MSTPSDINRILTLAAVSEISAGEIVAIASENVNGSFNRSQLSTCIEHNLLTSASKIEPQAFGNKFTEARYNRYHRSFCGDRIEESSHLTSDI